MGLSNRDENGDVQGRDKSLQRKLKNWTLNVLKISWFEDLCVLKSCNSNFLISFWIFYRLLGEGFRVKNYFIRSAAFACRTGSVLFGIALWEISLKFSFKTDGRAFLSWLLSTGYDTNVLLSVSAGLPSSAHDQGGLSPAEVFGSHRLF